MHGSEGLEAAERISQALFSGEISTLTEGDFEQLKLDGMPASGSSEASVALIQALVESELATSNKMAREFIGNGAVSVNGDKIADTAAELNWSSALFGKYFLLKRGKKLFHLLYKA